MGAWQPALGGGIDAFAAVLSPDGSTLRYATYVGGSGDDIARGLAVSSGPSTHLVGVTNSVDFPTRSPVQAKLAGGTDAFVVKLQQSGADAIYSTYVGGSGNDEARDVILDSARFAWVAGRFDGDHVIRIEPQGRRITSRTLLSNPIAAANAIGLTLGGTVAVVAGDQPGCAHGESDAWVAWVDSAGAELRYTTLTPCSGGEVRVRALAVPPQGSGAFLAGDTTRADPFMTCPTDTYYEGGGRDAFVAQVSDTGALDALVTPWGGANEEHGHAIDLGLGGEVWLAGSTGSDDAPTLDPIQGALANAPGRNDGFLTRLSPSVTGPPRADFTASPRSGSAPLVVAFQDNSACIPGSYLWDFGDGATSSLRAPSHTYLADGTYTVTLTTSNGAGTDRLTKSDLITVGDPIFADFDATPRSGIVPLTVEFSNQTMGNATSWVWDFGDGTTSTLPDPTHTYTTRGNFTVTLQARGVFPNVESKRDFVVTHEVMPGVEASPRISRPFQPIQFTDRSEGPVQSRLWSFGDGSTSTQVNPVHTYAGSGYYTVSLRVSGPTTTRYVTEEDHILVSPMRSTDIVTGPGPAPNAPPRVLGFDVMGERWPSLDFHAFGSGGFGVNVGVGQVDGAGPLELLVGPGPGPTYGPQVRAFAPSGQPLPQVNFYAYGTLRFGVAVDGADLLSRSFDDLLTSAAPSSSFGPHVRAFRWDAGRIQPLQGCNFFAYSTLRFGVRARGGDIRDGSDEEIVTAPGPGATFGPDIRAFQFRGGLAAIAAARFFAFVGGTHGARLGISGLEIPHQDLLVSAGPSPLYSSRVLGFRASNLPDPISAVDFVAFPGGVYGARPGGGDLDGDGSGEILVARAEDPTSTADIRGYEFSLVGPHIPSTVVTAIPSLGFTGYPTTYGIAAATGDLGF